MAERTLTPADVEAVARRVAELVASDVPRVGYVDTAAIARLLDVKPGWVRDHAAELGGTRLGNSKYGEWRFDVEHVRAWMRDHRAGPPAAPQRAGRARCGRKVQLLPLPEGARS